VRERSGHRADIAVIGGGLGGVAAALAAADLGCTVLLTEEYPWIGGQLTSQGVPFDEHPWIEQFGCTASYRRLRDGIRRHYRTWYPLTETARADTALNPGAAGVSKLCAEPAVGHAVLEAMLAPYRAAGRIVLRTRQRPVGAEVDGDRVRAVRLSGPDGDLLVEADLFLDATETGELLAVTGTEFVTGFESSADTREPHAPARAQPGNMQAASLCFAVEHRAGEDHTVDRPAGYEFWAEFRPPTWPDRLLSWTAPDPRTGRPRRRSFTPNTEASVRAADQSTDPGDQELWTFRRLLARSNFRPGTFDSDVCLVNWPMIDYLPKPLFGDPDGQNADRKDLKDLSLSMLYWMQTQAPRADGGSGFPGLRLRTDMLGTDDGLAQAPYVRESRRLLAAHRVTEQEVSLDVRGAAGAVRHPDAVGIGSYRIDLHPTTGGDGYLDIGCSPFQIPLRALLPQRVRNVLAAGKCLGTTHITNGCYRLHPVEWNTGEAAGTVAALALAARTEPAAFVPAASAGRDRFDDLHAALGRRGVETAWPEVSGY
jgi:hypothetical protein